MMDTERCQLKAKLGALQVIITHTHTHTQVIIGPGLGLNKKWQKAVHYTHNRECSTHEPPLRSRIVCSKLHSSESSNVPQQESKIEAENDLEHVRDDLNKSSSQLETVTVVRNSHCGKK